MLEKADVETREMFKNDKEQFLNSVQKIVDRFHNIFTILLGRTVDDGETATDEVILNIDNHQSWPEPSQWWYSNSDQWWPGLDNLADPLLVALTELLETHAAITTRVEDVEHVRDPLRVNSDEEFFSFSFWQYNLTRKVLRWVF